MRRISVLGIVLGGIVALILTVIIGVVVGLYAAYKLDIAHQSPAQGQALVRQFVYLNPVVYFGMMGIASGCSVLGGWISAFTAREAERLNGTLSALILAGIHVWRDLHNEDPHSLKVQVLYIAVLIAGAWVGGWLRAVQKAKLEPGVMTRV